MCVCDISSVCVCELHHLDSQIVEKLMTVDGLDDIIIVESCRFLHPKDQCMVDLLDLPTFTIIIN